MACVSCGNTFLEKYANNSYLELPVFHCKKCDLYVTGSSADQVREKTIQIYKEKFWGKDNGWDATKIIESNFTDIDSQGKKRHWISQMKYCKPYLENKKTVLEIGSGQGQAMYWFENNGFTVTGIEPDENNVKLINQKLNSHCVLGFVEDFEINEKFDIIWVSHVLEHLTKPYEFLRKIQKNLRDDGIFFIEVPNCENGFMLNSSISRLPHTFHFSKTALINLVTKAGYDVVKCDYFRQATKLDGAINKFKKFQYYPRIVTNSKKGKFLRVILKKSN